MYILCICIQCVYRYTLYTHTHCVYCVCTYKECTYPVRGGRGLTRRLADRGVTRGQGRTAPPVTVRAVPAVGAAPGLAAAPAPQRRPSKLSGREAEERATAWGYRHRLPVPRVRPGGVGRLGAPSPRVPCLRGVVLLLHAQARRWWPFAGLALSLL